MALTTEALDCSVLSALMASLVPSVTYSGIENGTYIVVAIHLRGGVCPASEGYEKASTGGPPKSTHMGGHRFDMVEACLRFASAEAHQTPRLDFRPR